MLGLKLALYTDDGFRSARLAFSCRTGENIPELKNPAVPFGRRGF
jgi:hypothetical protein